MPAPKVGSTAIERLLERELDSPNDRREGPHDRARIGLRLAEPVQRRVQAGLRMHPSPASEEPSGRFPKLTRRPDATDPRSEKLPGDDSAFARDRAGRRSIV